MGLGRSRPAIRAHSLYPTGQPPAQPVAAIGDDR
jgi:hypothetical protein